MPRHAKICRNLDHHQEMCGVRPMNYGQGTRRLYRTGRTPLIGSAAFQSDRDGRNGHDRAARRPVQVPFNGMLLHLRRRLTAGSGERSGIGWTSFAVTS